MHFPFFLTVLFFALGQCSPTSTTFLSQLPPSNLTTNFILCWTASNPSSYCQELKVPLVVERCEGELCLSPSSNENLQYGKMSPKSLAYYCKQCSKLINEETEKVGSSLEPCKVQQLPAASCTKLTTFLEIGNHNKIVSIPDKPCSWLLFLSCDGPPLRLLSRTRRGIGRGHKAFGESGGSGSEDGSNIVIYVAVGVVVVIFGFLVYWFFIRD